MKNLENLKISKVLKFTVEKLFFIKSGQVSK